MSISMEEIKELRSLTGVSITDCKKALEEAGGDKDKAIEILRKKGAAKALDRAGKITGEGIIVSYIHSNYKLGVLLAINCETDFVAKNPDFIEFGRDIAMHIAAINPLVINPSEVSAELIAKEREIWQEQLKNEGKPAAMISRILPGKEKKFREEIALLSQLFVKNPEITVEKYINEQVVKLGENIGIKQFIRYEI